MAWLIAEDDGAKKKVVSLLADRDEDLSLIRTTLQGNWHNCLNLTRPHANAHAEQLGGLSDEEPEQKDTKDMLNTLLQFV